MNRPKNNKAKILYALIKNRKGISERDFNLNSFRARISDVRHELIDCGIHLRHIIKPFKNEFNRKSFYRKHFLLASDIEKAKGVYEKINVVH